jgi:hypothetical protein
MRRNSVLFLAGASWLFGATSVDCPASAAQSTTTVVDSKGNSTSTTATLPDSTDNYLDDRLSWPKAIWVTAG